MRIVVTGREGQVARSLVERAATRQGIEVICLGRPGLDLATPQSILPAVRAAQPDLVVSAAAYTAVDAAEDEPERAHAVNGEGAGAVAQAARLCGAPLIHLSTDYVFSGESPGAYTEDMPTGPRSVYGLSKLAGERKVTEAHPDSVILRTSWVYSPFGRNFVRTMLRIAEGRDEVSVVDDQTGNPTSALDIADAVIDIAVRLHAGDAKRGIYHYAGLGRTTWCEFARHVFAESAARGGPHATVRAITTADYPTKATRPRNSSLDTRKITADFGVRPVDWRASVARVVDRLVAERLVPAH
jgi:dTDP-4-dehydrorhamnose reductase